MTSVSGIPGNGAKGRQARDDIHESTDEAHGTYKLREFPGSLTYSAHANDMIEHERKQIERDWVRRAVAAPELRRPHRTRSTQEEFFARVPEYGDRILRVIVDTGRDPWHVVTAYLDRNMKGRL